MGGSSRCFTHLSGKTLRIILWCLLEFCKPGNLKSCLHSSHFQRNEENSPGEKKTFMCSTKTQVSHSLKPTIDFVPNSCYT